MSTQTTLTLDENLHRYFDQARICRLATTGPDGPHVAPFALPSTHRERSTSRQRAPSGTIRNVVHDPRVVVLVDDYIEDWRGLKMLSITGTARSLTPDSGAEFEKAAEILKAKFPQFRWLDVGIAFVLAVDLSEVRRVGGSRITRAPCMQAIG